MQFGAALEQAETIAAAVLDVDDDDEPSSLSVPAVGATDPAGAG